MRCSPSSPRTSRPATDRRGLEPDDPDTEAYAYKLVFFGGVATRRTPYRRVVRLGSGLPARSNWVAVIAGAAGLGWLAYTHASAPPNANGSPKTSMRPPSRLRADTVLHRAVPGNQVSSPAYVPSM